MLEGLPPNGAAYVVRLETDETTARKRNEIRIVSVDVSLPDSMDVYLAGGERFRLNWDGMGQDVPDSRRLQHLNAEVSGPLQ